MTVAPLLEARCLQLRYGATWALRSVDMAVGKGEVVAVLGPTGAGKSTLFGALVGERGVDEGRVVLGGVDVTREPLWRRARRGLGYVPQGPSILPELTVGQNLETYIRLAGAAGPGVAEWAERAGLGHRLGLVAGRLSGGERKRLEITRALVAGPRVLVCDEPFAGMEPAGAWAVAEVLRRQARAGCAVVLADHRAEVALGICDRAVLLVDGAVELEAAPTEFAHSVVVRHMYLGFVSEGLGQRGAQGPSVRQGAPPDVTIRGERQEDGPRAPGPASLRR